MGDGIDPLFLSNVGTGDVSFRRDWTRGAIVLCRSRRRAKERQSKNSRFELHLEQIADVTLRSTGDQFVMEFTPTAAAAEDLAEDGWRLDDLTVVVDSRPKRELARHLMAVHYRWLVADLGLWKPAPTTLWGLNGSMTLSGTTVDLKPDGIVAAIPELVSCSFEFSEIVDAYLYDNGPIMYLQIFDEMAVKALLTGDADYAFDRALWLNLGQLPEAVPFYERLPRFGDRDPRGLKVPDDLSLQGALAHWSPRQAKPRAPMADPSLVGQLDRLAALHQEGALTQAEFEAAKNRLLS